MEIKEKIIFSLVLSMLIIAFVAALIVLFRIFKKIKRRNQEFGETRKNMVAFPR